MIKIFVKKQGNFAVNISKVKKELTSFLELKGLVSDFSVTVAIVGEKVMKDISKKFLGEASVHNVLSFTESEVKGDFLYPKGETLPLGEIILCYPKIVEEANKEGKLIDTKALELVKHAALHLLGEHHD
jgi:probable rRNA maturation factor